VVLAEEGSTAPEPWVCPETVAAMTNKTLNLYNWSTYIGENTVPEFEKRCGVTVISDFYSGNEELLTRLRTGNPGYDVVVPSDYAVLSMIDEGLLLPLDHSAIPNLNNLAEDLRRSPYDPDSTYAIPYLWGTFGLGYNTTKVAGEVSSWEQFFTYDGPVAWADDPRLMVSLALVMLGFDPNTSSVEEIQAAKQYLIDHSSNVVVIAADDGQEYLSRGEVDMVVEYNGDIFQLGLDCACEDYAYIIPKEGSGISAGFMAIPVGAQNPDLAQVFLDYILDPQVGAEIANFTTYPSPNQAAIDAGLIDPNLLENVGVYPPPEIREKLFFLLLQDVDTEALFNDVWTEIKLSIQAG
jgi:spermidine/putrescine transport system substrate-binding protein